MATGGKRCSNLQSKAKTILKTTSPSHPTHLKAGKTAKNALVIHPSRKACKAYCNFLNLNYNSEAPNKNHKRPSSYTMHFALEDRVSPSLPGVYKGPQTKAPATEEVLPVLCAVAAPENLGLLFNFFLMVLYVVCSSNTCASFSSVPRGQIMRDVFGPC